MKNSKRLFSKDMLILGFVLQLRFMFLAVIFSIFAGGYLYAATPVLIAEENFEGVMSCKLSSVGSFPVSPGIKIGMGIGGSSAYGFGRSSCGANAWDGYVNDLIFTFSKKCVITKVEFWEIERYENWGSQGWLIANGNKINDTTFGRLPSNDRIADSSFRKREFSLDIVSSGITFRCWDITDRSELFVDDIKIYGYIYDDAFTVAFNANGGVGDAIPIQGFSVNTPQKIFKNVYIKDGYVFQGWVSNSVERAELAAAGVIAVDYRDEELITVDSDMTLYAVWANPPLTLTADSANWSNGSITLKCEDSDTSGAEHSYTLEYCNENGTWVAVDDAQVSVTKGQNANNEEVWVVRLTDTGFSSRLGGIPPVQYHVKEVKSGRVSEPCVTRNRFLLSVGYDAYENVLRDKEWRPWQTPLGQSLRDVTEFKRLCESKGEFSCDNTQLLKNDEATLLGIRGAMLNFAERTKAGDIFVCYIATHGGDYTESSQMSAHLCTYDNRGYYTTSVLQTDFRAFGSGVAIVGIVMACHAKSIIGESDSRPGHEWVADWLANSGFGQCLGNIAWITSCDSSQSSYNDTLHTMFGQSFIIDGFAEGCADMKLYGTEYGGVEPDGFVTAGELGRYAREFANGWSSAEPSTVQLENGGLLDRIVLGRRTSIPDWSRPTAPTTIQPSQGTSDLKIKIDWTASANAQYYMIYRSVEGLPLTTEWIGRTSNGRTWFVDDVGLALLMSMVGLRYSYSVQAVNPIGKSEMSSEGVGWRGSEKYMSFLGKMIGAATASVSTEEYNVMEKMTAANGCRTVGECYALGINPEDPNDNLKISHFEIKDGKPVITLNHTEDGSGNSFMPRVKTLGKTNLDDAHEEWREVPTEGDPSLRFFKVEVELP